MIVSGSIRNGRTYVEVPADHYKRLLAVVRAAKDFHDGYAYTRTNPLTTAVRALTPDDIEAVQGDACSHEYTPNVEGTHLWCQRCDSVVPALTPEDIQAVKE